MKSFFQFALIAIASFMGVACETRANDSETDPVVAQAMEKVAKAVFDFMEDEGLKHEIIVGDISGMPNLKASGGVEISRLLEAALTSQGIRCHDDADTQLLGKFSLIEEKAHPDHDFDSLAMKVQLTIMDKFGKEMAEPEILVYGNQILQIAGLNTYVEPKASEKVKQETIIGDYHNPPTKLKANEIANDGPFAIEVLVVNNGNKSSKVPTIDSKGRPFVPLHLGEEYIVRIHNHADYECAATLVIDGVNVFVNTQDQDLPPNSKFIVKPNTSIDVPGWFITRQKSKAFEIAGYEESVARQQGESSSSTKIGTITAVFQACWAVGGQRPADEPGGTAKGGKATKEGRDISKQYEKVSREFGVLRSTISVRYDR